MEKGRIFRRHRAWRLRYRADGKQVSERLAPFTDQFRTVKSVRGLADEMLQASELRSRDLRHAVL
jgi:hypothetical protein